MKVGGLRVKVEDEGWIRCEGQGLMDEGLGLSVKGGGWRVD